MNPTAGVKFTKLNEEEDERFGPSPITSSPIARILMPTRSQVVGLGQKIRLNWLVMSCLLLATSCLVVFLVTMKVESDSKYLEMVTRWNMSEERQGALRREVQLVGGMLNKAKANVSRLEMIQKKLILDKPWETLINNEKRNIKNEIENSTSQVLEINKHIKTIQSGFDKLSNSVKNSSAEKDKFGIELKNIRGTMDNISAKSEQIELDMHTRLDRIKNVSQDLSVNHEDLSQNVYMEILNLEFNLETFQQEMEQRTLEQVMTNEEVELEIEKLQAALNMTVSHWADMKAGHNEFANKTLNILESLTNLRSQFTSTEANTEMTLDDIEMEEEKQITSTLNPEDPITSTVAPPKCTKPKKLSPKDITCKSSSQLNTRFSCKKAFDGKLLIGQSKSAWASKGEGVGAWIEGTFAKPVVVTQIKLLQRHQPTESNKKIELKFSSGLSQLASLPARGDRHWNIIKLGRGILTNSLTLTIKQVYGQINNGFKEIQVFGCMQ